MFSMKSKLPGNQTFTKQINGIIFLMHAWNWWTCAINLITIAHIVTNFVSLKNETKFVDRLFSWMLQLIRYEARCKLILRSLTFLIFQFLDSPSFRYMLLQKAWTTNIAVCKNIRGHFVISIFLKRLKEKSYQKLAKNITFRRSMMMIITFECNRNISTKRNIQILPNLNPLISIYKALWPTAIQT